MTLFERIVGSTNYLPEPQQVRLFLIDVHRSDPGAATAFGLLLRLNRCQATEHNLLPDASNVSEVLLALETYPLEDPFFLEIRNCPEPWPSPLGILLHWEKLAPGGYVYVATLFDATTFPNGVVGHAEIRASHVAPEPAFSVLRADTYEVFSQQDYERDGVAILLARSLKYVQQNHFKSLVPLSEATKTAFKPRGDTVAPPDSRFVTFVKEVLRGRMQCTEADVDISLVKAHRLDFALVYPSDVVDQSIRVIQMGLTERVLVYWDNGSFIMTDDYAPYLAYRKLDYKKVPVVVMGEFPEGSAEPGRIGGSELLPPILVGHSDPLDSLSPELQEFTLDSRLRGRRVSNEACKLYGLFIDLANLVRNPHTEEKQLHDLLFRNPVALDPFGMKIRTEVMLGTDYRVDLLVQYEYTNRRVLLIELERANIPVFTRKGRLRAKVTHAIQQVEDWLRWWREHPNEMPDGLDGLACPRESVPGGVRGYLIE